MVSAERWGRSYNSSCSVRSEFLQFLQLCIFCNVFFKFFLNLFSCFFFTKFSIFSPSAVTACTHLHFYLFTCTFIHTHIHTYAHSYMFIWHSPATLIRAIYPNRRHVTLSADNVPRMAAAATPTTPTTRATATGRD